MTNQIVDELFENILKNCASLEDEYERLKNLDRVDADSLRAEYCNLLLYRISKGFSKYDGISTKNAAMQIYVKTAELLPEEYPFFHAVRYYFKKENDKVLPALAEYLKKTFAKQESTGLIDEYFFVDTFFEPFKQAFPGFWSNLGELLRKYPHQPSIVELCAVVEKYYSCSTDEEALDLLLDMQQKFPDYALIKELIAYTYYSMKRWNNAIAYLEATEENGLFFSHTDANFMLAWCYGKLKDHKLEETYYRQAADSMPNDVVILNNLAYCLYLQKKFSEAEEILETCLTLDKNYVCSANNYLRVLLALGRHKDAKLFAKRSKCKISKSILSRLDLLDDSNTNAGTICAMPVPDETFSQEKVVDLAVKRSQFSSEKLLEDELTARIESGIEVFGEKLKIYKRRGQYGRQFIIPIGRLDLLCEDADGNLYIVELKKDSGYDDAYKQTAAYLDWFEQNELSKGKNVYGIICLNSPSKELLEKVHADKRMRLYEYQISYTER